MNTSACFAAKERYALSARGELFFYFLWGAALLAKFYFVELEISGVYARSSVALAASFSLCAAFAAALSLLPRRLRFFAALALDAAFSLLAVTDLIHMRFYSDLFTFYNLGLSGQAEEIADSVFALLSPRDVLYFCDITLFCLYRLPRGKKPLFAALNKRRAALSLSVLAASLCVFAGAVSFYDRRTPDALSSMWDRAALCSDVGVMCYHAADAYGVVKESIGRPALSSEERAEAALEFAAFHEAAPPPFPSAFGAARGANLIMIQAESLQSFVIGLRLNGREVTPNLNRFSREASFSCGLYVQTALGNSADAELLANAGLYPARSGVAYIRFADRVYEALPRVLRRRGYAAVAMHGDRAGFWNRARMYPALGFEKFISEKDYDSDDSFGLGISDASFFRQSLAILSRERRPFYAFLVTLSSHYPFCFPELLKRAGFDQGNRAEGPILRDYIAAVHYFDREFGRFIDGLKRDGLYRESVVIVYGDHAGIPKWDAAPLAKFLGKDLDEEHNWRSVNMVPFMVHLPGVERLPSVPGRAFGQIDIPASAAALLGVKFDSGMGRNIFAPEMPSSPVIFRNGSFVSGKTLVIPAGKSARDIATGAPADYANFSRLSESCARELSLSDKILEYGLRFAPQGK